MILIKQNTDILGSFSSSLCLIHCVATPFVFMAQTTAINCCEGAPIWWKLLDYFFLIISFYAIYWSTKATTINWIKPLLWLSWFMLMVIIMNEKLELLPLPEALIYIPSILLIGLHLYNRKYCNCNEDKCCVNEG